MSIERPPNYTFPLTGYPVSVNIESVSSSIVRTLEDSGVGPDALADLAGSLVWRIGRLSDETPVTVRIGSAQGLQQFGDLPRLRNATDQELEEALEDGSLRVEWVGPRL